MKKTAIMLSMAALAGFGAGAVAPDGYYDECNGLGGKNLLVALYHTVSQHDVVSYDGLWSLYRESDVDENGKIWDMYSSKRWNYSERCGNYSKVGDCYNREHSFPKSWFNDGKPMYSDAFHLYPTDGKVNGQRSNYPFGECENGTYLDSNNGVKALGKLGASTFPGYSGTVFEPVDEYKGDFARSYLYMAAAYNNLIANWNSDMLGGNNYPAFSDWAVELLVKWHRLDPVSQKELDRQEVVYSHQHNRNPFIDHPEMVEYIWGDKKNERWTATATSDPVIAKPADGSTVTFDITPVNTPVTYTLNVVGIDLTEDLNVTVSGEGFSASTKVLDADMVNNGCDLVVTFKASKAGSYNGKLALKSSEVECTVNLTAEAVDGIPALAATDVTENSFTARWRHILNVDTYTLHVMKDGKNIEGYPVAVVAADEQWLVENLEGNVTYSYKLTGGGVESNVISVTTRTPIPSIEYLSPDEVTIYADPDDYSKAVEMWIDVNNITADLTISVSAPFEVSTDMSSWHETITVSPDEERFYVRLTPSESGNYSTTIVITSGSYRNDEAIINAQVRDLSEPWFVEDFEDADEGYESYNTTFYPGRACDWVVENCGIWHNETENRRHGDYSLRLGNSSSSSITTAEPKHDGIGTLTFYGSSWSEKDGIVTISVQYSPDGEEWIEAASINLEKLDLTLYTVEVNAMGNNYLRLQQTAGKRGNIDDIVVTDYTLDSVLTTTIDSWTAYGSQGTLTIANAGEATGFAVFTVDGKMIMDATVGHGNHSLNVAPGIYIVTDDNTSRRVVVK